MRSGLVVMMAFAAPALASPKSSDPAFLGISMRDVSPTGPCQVDQVTHGSGAEAAGLLQHDTVLAFDRAHIDTCQSLLEAVTSHERGEWVTVDVVGFDGQPRILKVQLPSRGEILQRRWVGKRLDGVDLATANDLAERYDLEGTHNRATIVGWFAPQCTDCAYVFNKLAARPDERNAKAPPALAVAVTSFENPTQSTPDEAKRLQKGISVPLAVGSAEAFRTLTLSDPERITFMVLDCRGLVQYVAPIAPNSDDLDAALDELYAAADQARTSR